MKSLISYAKEGVTEVNTGVFRGEKHGNKVNLIFLTFSRINSFSVPSSPMILLPKKEGGKILVYFLLLSNTKATTPITIAAITAIAMAISVLISGVGSGSGSGSGSTSPPAAGAGPTETHVVSEELPYESSPSKAAIIL